MNGDRIVFRENNSLTPQLFFHSTQATTFGSILETCCVIMRQNSSTRSWLDYICCRACSYIVLWHGRILEFWYKNSWKSIMSAGVFLLCMLRFWDVDQTLDVWECSALNTELPPWSNSVDGKAKGNEVIVNKQFSTTTRFQMAEHLATSTSPAILRNRLMYRGT